MQTLGFVLGFVLGFALGFVLVLGALCSACRSPWLRQEGSRCPARAGARLPNAESGGEHERLCSAFAVPTSLWLLAPRHTCTHTHIHSIWDHTASIIPSVNLCEPSLSPLSPGSSVTPAHLISPLSPKWRVGVITRRSDRAREARACSRRRKGPAGSMMSPPPPSSSTYAHKSKQEGDVFNQKRKERGLNKSGHLSCNNAEFPGCICAYICLHASVKRAGK